MTEKKDKSRCLFCDAATGQDDEANLIVYRSGLAFVMLNRYPYTSGHIMIAPYKHIARLNEAGVAVAEEMIRIGQRAEEILEDIYHPDGLNLGMNLGRAAGAGIEQHIHMHVLPRWNGDANFMTSVGNTRVIPEALEDTYAKLKRGFQVG